MIRIGVIGIGHLGAIHTKLWANSLTASLVGIFDVSSIRSEEIAQLHNCTSFNSIETLIDSVDAVTIASSTNTHFEIAKQCIQAGKHCFIEKPITESYQQAQELIALAKEHSVILQVGHVERFNPAMVALSEYSVQPKFIEAHRLSQFKPRAIDVSVVHDLMIHDIDIVLWLVQSPVKSIDASGVNVLTPTIDIANARLTFENGCVANLTASRLSVQAMRKIRMFQENTYFSLDFAKSELEIFRIADADLPQSQQATMLGTIDAGTIKRSIYYDKPTVTPTNAIEQEHISFVKAIEGKAPIAVTADDGSEALRIVELIQEQCLSKL
ncbi:MAG: Gfo/Idh/MocA family oxidoreductase [Candidatus Kapabacteria bacterium]|jgi:predicted dehydrogenase|nr:Gfo/Idh/MocA family oxidoreductase [Candidatus Kapabacteria bacterium]